MNVETNTKVPAIIAPPGDGVDDPEAYYLDQLKSIVKDESDYASKLKILAPAMGSIGNTEGHDHEALNKAYEEFKAVQFDSDKLDDT